MSTTIAKYAAWPIADAYEVLGREFSGRKKEVSEFWGPADTKPSGRAYLVFAGIVVTLLVPLKIAGCLVSLLLNYAYSPVTIILTCLMLLLQKIGWMEKLHTLIDPLTGTACILSVAFWPLTISHFMAEHTTTEYVHESTVYLAKLHFLQMKLFYSLQKQNSQSGNKQFGSEEEEEEEEVRFNMSLSGGGG
jgi:hypothetical protein